MTLETHAEVGDNPIARLSPLTVWRARIATSQVPEPDQDVLPVLFLRRKMNRLRLRAVRVFLCFCCTPHFFHLL